MKKLTEEYDELEQAHETTYGEFKTVRDDLHRLWKVKSCVDTATRFNERAEEQKLQNRPQTRQKKEKLSRSITTEHRLTGQTPSVWKIFYAHRERHLSKADANTVGKNMTA